MTMEATNETNDTAPSPETEESDGARGLIERYVREVTRRLPQKQRDDVGRELRSSLLDALEDRFGPRPTWTQAAILLRETGPPVKVADSYRAAGQYLIGPGWFPVFSRVLRIVLTIFLLVLVGGFAVTIFLRPGSADVAGTLAGLLGGAVQGGLIAAAVVVTIFHLLERSEKPPARTAESWDPAELPPAHDGDLVERGEAMVEIVAPAAFLVVLYAFRDSLGLPLVPGDPPLLNDLIRAYLPWLSAATLLDMAHGVFLVWRGRHSLASRLAKFGISLFFLAIFYRFAADLAAERAELLAAGAPETLVDIIQRIAWSVPAVIAAITLFGIGKLVVRGLRRPAEAL